MNARMAKPGRPAGRSSPSRRAEPRLKLFRPIGWHHNLTTPVEKYVEHLLTELGRLGMEVHDIERYDRPPNSKSVLSDLMAWLGAHPGEAYAKLVNWQMLDLSVLRTRLKRDHSSKPRIELAAHITKMNNLSVRWYPRDWQNTLIDWYNPNRNTINLITHRQWPEPPDFHWFEGDENPTFDSRPSNELMYLRGVGNLQPEPHRVYGPYATFNDDMVDAILICAVRAAYEGLIEQLKYTFDVKVIDNFDFVLRDETQEGNELSHRFPVRRVTTWSLEDAAELKARHARDAAAKQEQYDRAELAELPSRHGFTIEIFLQALLHSAIKKSTGPVPSYDGANRNTAKALRAAGSKVTVSDVRRIRQLIERFAPDLLPPTLCPIPREDQT